MLCILCDGELPLRTWGTWSFREGRASKYWNVFCHVLPSILFSSVLPYLAPPSKWLIIIIVILKELFKDLKTGIYLLRLTAAFSLIEILSALRTKSETIIGAKIS